METYSTVFLTLTAFIVFVLRRRFTYWSRHGVKGANYPKLQRYFWPLQMTLVDEAKRFGRIYGGYTLESKYLIVNEPDLIRDILVRDNHLFPDRPFIEYGSSRITNSMGFRVTNRNWKTLRHISSPAFTTSKIKSMTPHIVEGCRQLANVLKPYENKDKDIDLNKHFGVFTQHVRARSMFGLNVDLINNHGHPIVVNGWRSSIMRNITLGMIVVCEMSALAKWLRCHFLVEESIQFFDSLMDRITVERKASKQSSRVATEKSKDLMQLMIDSEINDKELVEKKINTTVSGMAVQKTMDDTNVSSPANSISHDEIVGQGILFSGVGISASVLTHAVYYLSQNSECEQRLYEELKDVKKFTYNSLKKFKYLNAVINETLRLWPPVLIYEREAIQDYKLGDTGITVPKGTTAVISPYTLHRDPELWPEPQEFKPDRFIDGTHHPYAFIPFGAGPKMCLAQIYALHEIRVCLVHLLQLYKFTVEPGYQFEYFNGQDITLPKGSAFRIQSRIE